MYFPGYDSTDPDYRTARKHDVPCAECAHRMPPTATQRLGRCNHPAMQSLGRSWPAVGLRATCNYVLPVGPPGGRKEEA